MGRPPRSRENSKMLSTQIKSCLFLMETDSFCSLTVALHTRICQPTVKISLWKIFLVYIVRQILIQLAYCGTIDPELYNRRSESDLRGEHV